MNGKQIAHYQILQKLGGGGMGEVYRARDTRLRREVAIKFLGEKSTSDPERLARFLLEARSASALNHPNIITVHDIGEADGKPYIVMELVQGQTLREIMSKQSLPLRRTLDLGAQIADGLAKAHAAGIVHRDLKPENIMISGDRLAKILDFGLAKFSPPPLDTEAETVVKEDLSTTGDDLSGPKTGPGALVGTVKYMSPEQARGDTIDHRSDQFSLGSLLYEMTTGRNAFDRGNWIETTRAICNEPPVRVREWVPDCPELLVNTINRCLAKDPADRYPSCEELARDLRAVADRLEAGGPMVSAKPALGSRVRRFLAVGAALAAVILLAILSPPVRHRVADWLSLRAVPEEKHIAVLSFAGAGDDPASRAFSEGLVEVLTSKLTELEQFHGSLWVVPASEVRQADIASAAAARRVFGVTIVITGSVLRVNDRIRLTANLVDALSLRQLRAIALDAPVTDVSLLQDGVVDQIVQMLALELDPHARRLMEAGGTTEAGAFELYVKGRGYLQHYEDKESLDMAIKVLQQATSLDPRYALAYAALGEAFWRRYELEKSPESVGMAQRSCRRAVELNDLLAPVYVTLGVVHAGTGHPEDARKDFDRALELDPANADAMRELAYAYETLGKNREAEATYLKAIRWRPSYWAGYNQLGVFYLIQARYSEAEAQFRKVIELAPVNVRGYNNLGGLYHLMGRNEEAEAMLKRSLSIMPTADAASSLATVQFFRGRYAEAARTLERAVEIDDGDYRVWRNLGAAYRLAPGQGEKAPAAYRRAAEMAEAELKVNPSDPGLLIRLADCHAVLGDAVAARARAAEALELARGDADMMFRAATVYEMLGDRAKALDLLGKALHAGYSLEEVEHEPDLARLRADPRFATVREP
ncbi:MAG: protein kinase [Acidobacteria bacterium]|nr:protein kinase [Acidobacteriota bacterium]